MEIQSPYSTPFTKEELDTRFAQVEDDIRNGRTYPIDDLLDEYDIWDTRRSPEVLSNRIN